MKISLSKRERILIVGSLVAIILFVYMLLILPRFKAKIEDQEGRLSVLRSQLTSREKRQPGCLNFRKKPGFWRPTWQPILRITSARGWDRKMSCSWSGSL